MARNILLVGNGAREHAIAQSLCMSENVHLFAFMSAANPGISALCEASGGKSGLGNIHDPKVVSSWAGLNSIDLAFPSPDAVLEAGVVDALGNMGVRCAAPIRDAARLEWDKAFARHLMKQYKIPGCPRFGYFESDAGLDSLIDELGSVAIKPVGLTGGKGVRVSGDQLKTPSDAARYAREVLSSQIGGKAAVVVEEKLEGEEFTLQAFVDGKNVVGMPTVQDHKRAYENDVGPNTGGMGSYTGKGLVLPFLKPSDYSQAIDIMKRIVRALSLSSGITYKGVLYGQFMATKDGVSVVEFNSRFGDPEAMNVLALLGTPLADIFDSIADGNLSQSVDWLEFHTVVKYLVPKGYPIKSVQPSQITIDHSALAQSGARLFYASVDSPTTVRTPLVSLKPTHRLGGTNCGAPQLIATRGKHRGVPSPEGSNARHGLQAVVGDMKGGRLMTGQSRTIASLGIGESYESAEKTAEKGTACVHGPLWHRADIGTNGLIKKRMDHMREIRG